MRSRFSATLLLVFFFFWRGVYGQQWTRLGPEGGAVQSLAASSTGELFLGTADGHVFASKDAGNSWEMRGRAGNRLDAVVTRLVAGEHAMFVSVWYQQGGGGGVFQSADGGRTWKLIGLEQEAVRALEIAPSQTDELLAGTLTGVFRSSDSGKTWTRISPPGDQELRNIDSIAIDPHDPAIVYVGTFHLPWKTTDGGKNWKPITAGVIDDSDVMSIRVDSTNPERLYMSACSGIYRSENRGAQWTKMQGIPYSARRTQAIVQDPSNSKTLYAGTTEGLWVTRDGGESWTRTTAKDWIVNSVVVLPENAGRRERVLLGTEGQGVQLSDDAGVTFAEANRGFNHTLVRQLISRPNQTAHLLLIVQHGGWEGGWEVLESHDAGRTLQPMGMSVATTGKTTRLSLGDVQTAYASPWGWLVQLRNGRLWICSDARQEWREWNLRIPAPRPAGKTRTAAGAAKTGTVGVHTTEMVRAFSQDAAFVSTREGLLRCVESGACSRVRAFTSGEAIFVWASTSGKEIAAVTGGKLGLSSNAGETAVWRDLPVAAERIVCLDASGSVSDSKVYLGTSGGLFVSDDAGEHWKKVGGGLPPAQIDQWLRVPEVCVATERDGGVYISRDQGTTWSRVDHDAERSRFVGLVEAGGGAVLAGSQSEGLLRLEHDTKGQ